MKRTGYPITFALLLALLPSCGGGDGGPGGSADGRRARTAADTRHADEIHGEMSTAEFKEFTPEQVRRGGRIVIPLLVDVDSFNPYLSTSAEAGRVHDLTYLRLLEEHADYHKGPPSFTPLLAAELPKRDGNKLHYRLRDDAVWSDDVPVTSNDVRFSWLAAKNPDVAWANSSIVDQIENVEVHDDKNFTIHFTTSYPDMLMDSKDTHIIPAHVFDKIPFKEWKSYPDWDKASAVVNGYYTVDRYKHNEEFVLKRNSRFWDTTVPLLDEIHFRVIRSRQTAFDALQAGEIDVQPSVLPLNARKVLDHPDYYLYTYLSRVYYYIGWNCKHDIFKDPAVRRAMTMAIDREDIVQSIFLGYAKVTASPILTSFWANDRSLKPYPYDPERALELLRSRGWEKGPDGILQKDGVKFRFTLSTNSGNEVRAEVQQFAQAQLKRIGIDCRITTQDFNTWGENLQRGKEDAWVAAWNVATKVDPKAMFHTAGIGHFNYCQYSNPKIDALIERGRVESNREKALAIWKEFQGIWYEEQPYTIIGEVRDTHALNKRFHNVEMNSLTPYFNIWGWFVPKGTVPAR